MASSSQTKYRLVTRSDFDGLVCAVLLRHLDMLGDVLFVHPKDVQDGKVAITENDILTNLPYSPNAHLVFDHHLSETLRIEGEPENRIIDPNAPSAARVVFEHYGGFETFPFTWDDMMVAVDKADSAQFSQEEILYPRDWVLLNFLMDARTGLGRFRNFRISNYQLMMELIDYCRFRNIDDILAVPDVQERVKLFEKHQDAFRHQLDQCSSVFDDLVVIDLRNEVTIYPGNRFMIYALNPACTLSIHAIWGLKRQNTVFAVGKSIVNRSSTLNIGKLMLEYGGGGHANAGTCQVSNEAAHGTLESLIQRITGNSFGYIQPTPGTSASKPDRNPFIPAN